MLHQTMLRTTTSPFAFPEELNLIGLDIDDCIARGSMGAMRDVWVPGFARRYKLPYEEAYKRNMAYIPTYGCSALGFATENGLKHPKRSVNRFYATTGKATAARYAELYQPDTRLPTVIASLKSKGFRVGIITLGHPTHADAVLKHHGIFELIEPKLKLYRVDKAKHWVYHRFLRMAGAKPHQMLMADDGPRNLKASGEIGITNMMVGDRDPGEYAPFVHSRFPTLEDGLEALNRQYA